MKAAQFFKGIINGVADSYETPDLLQILPSSKLAELWDRDQLGEYPIRIFKQERVVAKTVVTKAEQDAYGRDGLVNHTVLYRFDACAEHDGLSYLFPMEQFIQDAVDGKFNFKMPPHPELKKPLDAPPAMEV